MAQPPLLKRDQVDWVLTGLVGHTKMAGTHRMACLGNRWSSHVIRGRSRPTKDGAEGTLNPLPGGLTFDMLRHFDFLLQKF